MNLVKYAKFGNRILRSKLSHKIDPYKLTLAMTYDCNSRCKICNIWKKKPKKELSLEEYRKFFSKYNKFEWIAITGGEVFMKDYLSELCRIINDNSKNLMLITFTTNGLLPNKINNQIRKILKLNIPKIFVSISLDGPKIIHDELRGIKGNFEKVMKTYEHLKKITSKKFEVYFGYTISKYNINYFEQTVKEVQEYHPEVSYNNFHINIAQNSSHFYENTDEELNSINELDMINQILSKRKYRQGPVDFIERSYVNNIPRYIESKKCPLSCKSLQTSVFISPNGDILPCATMNDNLGNIKDHDYDLNKILNLDKTESIIQHIRQQKCPHCWTACEAYQAILSKKIL